MSRPTSLLLRCLFALVAVVASGCDALGERSRSVELHGQVLDAETHAPIVGALWGVSNSCGYGTYTTLARGFTDAQGRFVASYEYPVCDDPILGVSVPADDRYPLYRMEVYGRGRVNLPPILLQKKAP